MKTWRVYIYILSYSLIIYKILFVKKYVFPTLLGPVIITRQGWIGYKIFSTYKIQFYLLINGLTKTYTIKDIKHKNYNANGIENNRTGIIISRSQSVLSSSKILVSLVSVILVIYIYILLNGI